MDDLGDVLRPTLLLDETRARENSARRARKARRHGLVFRPHFKTHQSAAVGEWLRDAGVRAIGVSSLSMAAYFAEAGWDDITVAIPFNPRETALARELAGRVKLGLVIADEDALFALASQGEPLRVWVEPWAHAATWTWRWPLPARWSACMGTAS